jgi:hypothetical protein
MFTYYFQLENMPYAVFTMHMPQYARQIFKICMYIVMVYYLYLIAKCLHEIHISINFPHHLSPTLQIFYFLN